MSDDVKKLVDDIRNTPGAKAVYVNVLFYDFNLRSMPTLKMNRGVYEQCLMEFSTNRTINGVPLFVIADKRHPSYRIV